MLLGGISTVDVALLIDRLALGTFFVLSGYHKLFNEQRHMYLRAELNRLQIPYVRFNQWWVPGVEFVGGLSLIVGLMTTLSALGLLVIMITACCLVGKQRVVSYQPIDVADAIDDWLYLQEILYGIMLLMLIVAGAGKYSLDRLF